MFPGLEGSFREGEVGVGRCGYYDEVDGGISEHFGCGVVYPCGGVVFGCIVVGLRGALDNGVEMHLWG